MKKIKVNELISAMAELDKRIKLSKLKETVSSSKVWVASLYRVVINRADNMVILIDNDVIDPETGKSYKEYSKPVSIKTATDKFDAYTGYCVAVFKRMTGLRAPYFEKTFGNYFEYEDLAREYLELMGITREVFESWIKDKKGDNISIEAVAGSYGPLEIVLNDGHTRHTTEAMVHYYLRHFAPKYDPCRDLKKDEKIVVKKSSPCIEERIFTELLKDPFLRYLNELFSF